MSPPRTTLQGLIDKAQQRHGTTSTPKLAEIAQKKGHKLNHTTISQIRSGKYRSEPAEDTLRAIAFLAGVPYRVAYEAAGLGVLNSPFVDQLPRDVDRLTPKQRTAVLAIIRLLIDAEKAVREAQRIDTAGGRVNGEGVAFVTEDAYGDQDENVDGDMDHSG